MKYATWMVLEEQSLYTELHDVETLSQWHCNVKGNLTEQFPNPNASATFHIHYSKYATKY